MYSQGESLKSVKVADSSVDAERESIQFINLSSCINNRDSFIYKMPMI